MLLEHRKSGVFSKSQGELCDRLHAVAQRVETVVVDDLDGVSLADETVRFAVDGTAYEIDLTAQHAADLRSFLNSYVAAARRLPGRRKAG